MTVDEWAARLPMITWDEPVKVVVAGGEYLLCRVCIAERGLRGADAADRSFSSMGEFRAHLEAEH